LASSCSTNRGKRSTWTDHAGCHERSDAKRDRGAAIVLASHDPQDLAGICDLYLFLVNRCGTLFKAHELSGGRSVTPALLEAMLERLQVDPTAPLRAAS